jgi:hypothetical protein
MAITEEKIKQVAKLLDENLLQKIIGEIVGLAQPTVSIIARVLGKGRKRGLGSPSCKSKKEGNKL